MKKKMIVLMMVGAFLLGGVTVYAAGNYYAQMVLNQKEDIKRGVTERYQEKYAERGQQQHHDMTAHVWTQVEELKERLNQRVDEKVTNDADDRLEEHIRAVQEAIEQVEAEMIEYINNLD